MESYPKRPSPLQMRIDSIVIFLRRPCSRCHASFLYGRNEGFEIEEAPDTLNPEP